MKHLSNHYALLGIILLLFACNKNSRPQNRYSEPAFRFESYAGQANTRNQPPAQKPDHATYQVSETTALNAFEPNVHTKINRKGFNAGSDQRMQVSLQDAAEPFASESVRHSKTNNNAWYKRFFSKTGILLGGGALTAVLMLMLKSSGRRNRISLWAHRNAAAARTMLIPGQAALLFSGVYAGKHLAALGIAGSGTTAMVLSGLGLAGVMLYPLKQLKSGPLAYSTGKHKAIAGLLTGLGLCAAVNLGAADAAIGMEMASVGNDDYVVGKIFLSLLALAAFLFLAYVLVAITCELICLDLFLLAILVGGGGAALIIYLLVRALKAIWYNRVRSVPTETQIHGKG